MTQILDENNINLGNQVVIEIEEYRFPDKIKWIYKKEITGIGYHGDKHIEVELYQHGKTMNIFFLLNNMEGFNNILQKNIFYEKGWYLSDPLYVGLEKEKNKKTLKVYLLDN